jgi:putative ABC transport system permease protein
VDFMIAATFDGAERQDATLTFADAQSGRAALDAARLPGVIAAEPFRAVPVRIHAGPVAERTTLLGKPATADLNRIVDVAQQPVAPPDTGVALASALAAKLGVGRGDRVLIAVMEGRQEVLDLPVTAIVEQYFGLSAYMERGALNRLLREGDAVSGVHVALDAAAVPAFYAAVKETPVVAGLGLTSRAVARFRSLIDDNISTMIWVYAGLAAVIAFGVVYNAVRIRLSERARELASLRVLGFTRAETARILLLELALLGLAAIPLGWGLGWALALTVSQGLQSDLYRVPVVVDRSTYAAATALYLAVAGLSAFAARRRIDRLDLIGVLKTRE